MKKWKKLEGNYSILDVKQPAVTPAYLTYAPTESMDNMDGKLTPKISDQNVVLAKEFVDDNEK